MQQVASSAEELASIAEELQNTIALFKLKEGAKDDTKKSALEMKGFEIKEIPQQRKIAFEKHEFETQEKLKEAQERLRKMREERVKLQGKQKEKEKK